MRTQLKWLYEGTLFVLSTASLEIGVL